MGHTTENIEGNFYYRKLYAFLLEMGELIVYFGEKIFLQSKKLKSWYIIITDDSVVNGLYITIGYVYVWVNKWERKKTIF